MSKMERGALWVLIIGVAVTAFFTTTSLGTLEEQVAGLSQRVSQPVVRSEVIQGVPDALHQSFQETMGNPSDTDEAVARWLTVRLSNAGVSAMDDLQANMRLDVPIQTLYARSAGTGTGLDQGFGSPEVNEGGQGESSVTVNFPGSLDIGGSHLLFIGISPDTATTAAPYWNALEVQATPDGYGGDTITFVSYPHG